MKINSLNARSFVQHIENLSKLAEIPYHDALKLYYRLVRLEAKAHRLTEYECNTGNDMDEELNKIKAKVNRLITATWKHGSEVNGLFINGDPRGYSLKIKSEVRKEWEDKNIINLYSDWGGYGILAPEF